MKGELIKMSVVLEYKDINKSFGEKHVLKDINLKIESNKMLFLLVVCGNLC